MIFITRIRRGYQTSSGESCLNGYNQERKYRKNKRKMAYGVIMLYHLHMPSYILRTFTEYPFQSLSVHSFYNFSFFYAGKFYETAQSWQEQ